MPGVRKVLDLLDLRAVALLVTAATIPTLAACSDDGASPEEDAADTAAQVCGLLVDWSNDLTASMNATSKTITDADDPDTANGVLLDGFDELIELAQAHVDQAGELDLPDNDNSGRLVDELRAGAEKSIEELERGRANAADLDPIDIDGQPGAIGGAMNAVESAKSVVEPVIAAYHDDVLQQAFTDEPDCLHVIQPS
jgi:hypothetical protein